MAFVSITGWAVDSSSQVPGDIVLGSPATICCSSELGGLWWSLARGTVVLVSLHATEPCSAAHFLADGMDNPVLGENCRYFDRDLCIHCFLETGSIAFLDIPF